MKRRRWLPWALLLAASGAGLWWYLRPRQPNVLLIVVDTLRADRLGTHGYGRPTSPRIDAFADRAVVFEDALSPAPWTTPAVASILTGLPPAQIGVRNRAIALPDHLPTLAQELGRRGYATAGIVSHLFIGSKLGFDRGFDEWNEDHAQGHEHVSSEGLTDLALEYLERRVDAPEPFLLFVHYFDPHYDYVEQDYPELLRPTESRLTSERDNIDKLRRRASAGRYGEEDIRYLNDLYDAEIRYTDEHIGRLLDGLEALDLYDDTLVILTADHGEALMDRADRWIGHTRTLFQELIHVPLIVKPSGRFTPRRVSLPVSTMDVYPTILSQVPAQDPPAPERLARSLLGEITLRPHFAATYRDAELQAVRHGRWKLVHEMRSRQSLLFDLATDPLEQEDVSAANPEVRRDMEEKLMAWHAPLFQRLILEDAEQPAFSLEELERIQALGY